MKQFEFMDYYKVVEDLLDQVSESNLCSKKEKDILFEIQLALMMMIQTNGTDKERIITSLQVCISEVMKVLAEHEKRNAELNIEPSLVHFL